MTAPSAGPHPTDDRGVGLALLTALSFSTLGIWGKLATQAGLQSYNTLTWRFGAVALLLLPLTSRGLTPAMRGRMLAVGVLYALATTCYFGALDRITAGATGLLLFLAPAFVIVLNMLLGQRPGAVQLGAVALACAGLALVVGLPEPADRDPLGLLLGAGAGLMYATYLLASERLLAGLPALACTAHMALSAAVYFGVLAALSGQLQVPAGQQWLPVLGIVVFPTLLAVPSLYAAIGRLGAAQASLLGTLEPLFTVLLAFVVLHEPLRPSVLVGGGLILGGAVLSHTYCVQFPKIQKSTGF